MIPPRGNATVDSMIKTAIIGIGQDGFGREGIALARALAPQARLMLVSAFPYPAHPDEARDAHVGYREALRDRTTTMLGRVQATAGASDAECFAVPDTSPPHALKHFAAVHNADLIVLGSAHHGALGRITLGDVAHGVLQGATCPVLVAPQRPSFRAGTPSRIGIAYDGSPEAEHALTLAVALADTLGGEVEIVQALDVGVIPQVWGWQVADYLHGLVTPAQERLDALAASLPVPARGLALQGATHAVLAQASAHVDLMVCGSRGWGPAARLAFGSVAERLMRDAAVPVIVVPRAADTAAIVAAEGDRVASGGSDAAQTGQLLGR